MEDGLVVVPVVVRPDRDGFLLVNEIARLAW